VPQLGDSVQNWWYNCLKALPKIKKSEICPYDVHSMEYLERKEHRIFEGKSEQPI